MADEPAKTTDETKADKDRSGPRSSEKRDTMPAAGPHAKPSLTDAERTPGAGTLPDVGEDDVGDGASS